jgi:hypothetical protein
MQSRNAHRGRFGSSGIHLTEEVGSHGSGNGPGRYAPSTIAPLNKASAAGDSPITRSTQNGFRRGKK